VARVYWAFYGEGRFWEDNGIWSGRGAVETKRLLGEPIRVAAAAAKRHGLEIFAYYKPYESGVSALLPEGSPEARRHGLLPHLGASLPVAMRYVAEHPDQRIRRRTDDLPAGLERIPIRTLRLYGRGGAPTRIRRGNIQIWTSERNYRYERKPVAFEFASRVVPAPRDFIDHEGRALAGRGEPVREITLSGLDLLDRYILVTTDFEDDAGDFETSAVDMLRAFGPAGEIPISVGAGGVLNAGRFRDSAGWKPGFAAAARSSVWAEGHLDFRTGGVEFDMGFGRVPVLLDVSNRTGKVGYVALARGRNRYLPTALCESHPAVQEYWLSEIRACLDAGVDGVDFRIENHSTHTDDPFAYGFNDVVLEEYRRRHGDTPERDVDLGLLAEIRGERYDAFLGRARDLIRGRGKTMQLHFNVEFLRPEPRPSRRLAYPWNIRFDWRKWIDAGLAGEATLRTFQYTPEFVLGDPFSLSVIGELGRRGIPIHYNRYVRYPANPATDYVREVRRLAEDGRFRSVIVYETNSFLSPSGDGVEPKGDFHATLAEEARRLGLR
jgi:hypothetical protein